MLNLKFAFRCVAEAVCAKGVKALVTLPLGPFGAVGEFVYDVEAATDARLFASP